MVADALIWGLEKGGMGGTGRVSQQELRDAFVEGWQVESIEAARFEVRPDLEDIQSSDGGPFAWLSVIRRVE